MGPRSGPLLDLGGSVGPCFVDGLYLVCSWVQIRGP